ncbi:hypothetical protein ITI46_09985 [Streptomyces oryzae]|uniref:Uncharacterized protein n=1 Tax=Streptomyces oryzae TaxID=1434886 RepID=A0ABS3X9H0_9ACTN|nr:hypothetical protein [Streptomyces oryzae]MBO8191999.1 hypothetical protein [Streptomyces oryzae]
MDRITLSWALVYAGFGLVCALKGTHLFPYGGVLGPRASGWAVTAVGTLAALTCTAVSRYGLRPALRTLLWTVCGLSGLAAFSLLMDVITLMFGQGVDSWASAANHALAAVGTLLSAGTARSARPCLPRAAAPAASAAPRPHQLAAWAGTVAFLPYAAMKQIWAFGGTFAGISGAQMSVISERNGASGIWLTLESWGLDPTMLLAALGVFLLWGLVRPWGQVFPRWTPFLRGRRVPRWLPLAPSLIGAATLAPYGVLGVGYAVLATVDVVTMRSGDFPTPQDALLVTWIGMAAFAIYGCALMVGARSYWLRTRTISRGIDSA